jgi:regulator of protease activity HflC (stomatin/prohibitin superfamily)
MYRVIQLLTLGLFSVVIVRQGEVRVIERRGRFSRVAGPGINFLWSLWGAGEVVGGFSISHVIKGPDGRTHVQPRRGVTTIPTRTQVDDYPSESVITKDNLTINIDAVVYYRVFDPNKAIYEVQDYVGAVQKLVQSALRDQVAQYDLDDLLTGRDKINNALRTVLDEATDPWGIKVDRVELKDIDLGAFGKVLAEQRAAETRRRTEITEAEGQKRSAILRAEGERESAVLEARGKKESAILAAEASAEGAILKADAEAQAILRVREAEAQGFDTLAASFAGKSTNAEVLRVLEIQKAELTAGRLAAGPATKIFLPADISNLFGLIRPRGDGAA